MKATVVLLCCFNIAWIFYTSVNRFSCEQLFALLCYLFTLIFIAKSPHPPPTLVVEEGATALLRKQIQEINWRILSSKASTLIQLKKVLKGRNEKVRRCSSGISPSVSKKLSKLHPWKSWSGSLE